MGSSRFSDRYGLSTIVAALSSPAAAPAAGSACAATTALAAAVVAKLAVRSGDTGLAAQAELLAKRSSTLVADDADAFERALQALHDPRTETAAGDFWLGVTLDRAARIPAHIADAAADVALLAREAALVAPPDLAADAACAAILAAGAARAAAQLVRINLSSMPGDTRLRETDAAAARAEEIAAELEAPSAGG